jgi:transposase
MPRGRQHTADEKLRILEEARQAGTTVAEVLRRHQLDATTFYRWERQAKDAMRQALSGTGRRDSDAKDREIERLQAELARKSRVIAEVVEENLGLKKGSSSN